MTSGRAAPLWVLSFADLCLLLLGFFIMLHAISGPKAKLVNGIHEAFGAGSVRQFEEHEIRPAALFEPGEAVLHPAARSKLAALGHKAFARKARVKIESLGMDRATLRFDGWELAAARTAAVARAISAGGLPQAQISISIPEMTEAGHDAGQRIAIEIEGPQQPR